MMTNSDARKRQAGESRVQRGWKPGDVAMAPNGEVVLRNDKGQWANSQGERFYIDNHPPRPLVVLDPGDVHQVRRLDDLIQKHLDDPSAPQYLSTADLLAMALRDFASPPTPDEPTGIGAVVEDENGDLWVRVKGDSWACGLSRREWAYITAARVLSDGVQP